MGESDKTEIPRLRITYYDEERSPDVVVCGQWEVALADRKYGVGSTQVGGVEAIAYAAYHGAKRAGLLSGNQDFDNWARTVASVDNADPGESLAQPGS